MRAFLLGILAVAACGGGGGGGGGDGSTLEQPWTPATGTADYSCASCVEFATTAGAHTGEVSLLADPTRDDPRRQWQRCFATFYACWDEGGTIDACVADAVCPSACKDEFARRATGLTELRAQVAAYRAVFIDADAPCRDPGPPAGGAL